MYKLNFVHKATASTNLGNQKIFYIIVLASMLMAMLFGLFAVTANPIIISLAVALIAGLYLLAKPDWIMWLVLSLGLLVVGVLPLHFDFVASKAAWSVSLLGFALLFLAFIRAAAHPGILKHTPLFVWLALFFLIFSVLNSLVQWYSAYEFLGGIKRYFQMYGLLFILSWATFEERDIHRWQIFFLIVALVQLPTSIYELLVFAPLLQSTWGVAAVDLVAGTFGAQKQGGGANGEMALFLIIMLAFLFARHKQKVLSLKRLILLSSFLIVPFFLGETKAIIVMLPLMFLVLYRHEIFTRFHYWLLGFIVATIVTMSVGFYLFSLYEKPIDQHIEQIIGYNFKETGYGKQYLNRTTVLTFWAEKQGAHDPVSLMFGNGLGSSHTIAGGHIAKDYPGYGIDLTSVSVLLWDVGVFGFSLFVAIFFSAWNYARKLWKESVIPAVRADAIAIQASLALFAFHLFYRVTLLELTSIQIVFYSILGYLALLYRNHSASCISK